MFCVNGSDPPQDPEALPFQQIEYSYLLIDEPYSTHDVVPWSSQRSHVSAPYCSLILGLCYGDKNSPRTAELSRKFFVQWSPALCSSGAASPPSV